MMNLSDSKKSIASVLVSKAPFTNGMKPSMPEEKEVHEEAAELELTKELISAIKENKPEKANKALMMLIRMCYDNYEEEEDRQSDETPES